MLTVHTVATTAASSCVCHPLTFQLPKREHTGVVVALDCIPIRSFGGWGLLCLCFALLRGGSFTTFQSAKFLRLNSTSAQSTLSRRIRCAAGLNTAELPTQYHSRLCDCYLLGCMLTLSNRETSAKGITATTRSREKLRILS